jgi:hypothetical protein
MIPLTLSNDNLVTVLNGNHYKVSKDSRVYREVLEGIKEGLTDDEIVEIFNSDGLASYTLGSDIEIKEDKFFIDNEELKPSMVKRIKEFANSNLPIDHFVNFVRAAEDNPSKESKDEGFDFLDYKGLPITDDGCFLAYKAIRGDYTDIYTGTVDNRPRKLVEMKRNKVDDDRAKGCSDGLHVGTIEYVRGYAKWNSQYNPIIILVKVNPKDIVSVPHQDTCQKCRVCEYLVLEVMHNVLDKALYTSDADEYEHDEPEEYDDDSFWDEDELDDDDEDRWDEGDVTSSWPIPTE